MPTSKADRSKVAVLPFADDELFRDERRELRQRLAAELAKRLPEHDLVPLSEVDAKLAPISKGGARCAFDAAPLARRASGQGWLTTELVHVSGFKDQPDQLWVQLSDWQSVQTTLASPWDSKLQPIARYERAFSELKILPQGGGLLGGLAGTSSFRDEVTVGSLSLCQRQGFRDCVPETKSFVDRAPELSACFSGVDEEQRYVLFEGAGRCELENLDDLAGPDGRREACLCAALSKSAGASAGKGRRRLALRFEAMDLLGKPRPEIRVVDTSSNLHADDDLRWMNWQGKHKKVDSKVSWLVRRLSVDHLDALRPALSRCAVAADTTLVAELSVSEAGVVQSARVVTAAKDKRGSACVEKALASGTFSCTDNGAPATLRLAISWPK